MREIKKIGIFDSGLGGLTVFKKLKKEFPWQPFIYLGDLAHLPYGDKSDQSIIERSKKITNFFIKNNVSSIIVACNSASSVALKSLRFVYDIPIIGVINPSISFAIQNSSTNVIGVIGTQTTISSKSYNEALSNHIKTKASFQLIAVPCPLFVPLVEEGWENTNISYQIAKKYCAQFQPYNNMDTLILGCTHYPILIDTLKTVFHEYGYENLTFIECGDAVINSIQELITIKTSTTGEDLFFVTDTSHQFQELANKFLGYKTSKIQIVSL